jgi:hypothetical protein
VSLKDLTERPILADLAALVEDRSVRPRPAATAAAELLPSS